MNEKEKKRKVQMRHYRLSKKLLITIKMLTDFFRLHQKLIKENQKQSLKKALQRG